MIKYKFKTVETKNHKKIKNADSGKEENQNSCKCLASVFILKVSKLENLPFESDIYELVNCFVMLAC
jgi:hypothetical protein